MIAIPDWAPLRRELSAFREDGRRLPIWWRDDDAVRPTIHLDRLRGMAVDLDLPVHLAIIPVQAQPDLLPALLGGPLRGVVHGWAHLNHAPDGEKSSEFGTPRPEAGREAARGLAHLRSLYGAAVHPMFVPPWNRMDPGLAPGLARSGYRWLSGYGPREAPHAAPGLAAINTHVDPVDWRGTRGLADPGLLLGTLTEHLRARRLGAADNAEPLGLLTHHLMMDDPTWEFCRALLEELQSGPVDCFDIAGSSA